MDYKDFQLQKDDQEMHFWFKAKNELIFNLFYSVFKGQPKERLILDIGCGTGTGLREIEKYGSIDVLDVRKEVLEQIEKQGYKMILVDIEKYDLPKNYYDIICCFDIFEHLQSDQKVIDNIFSSLKKEGVLIFTVPAMGFLFSAHDLAMDHLRRYGKKEIRIKLEKAGFKIIELNFWNTLLFPAILVLRLVKKFFIFFAPKNIKYVSEAKALPKYLNRIFFFILSLENGRLWRKLPKPFGLTLYGIAKKI